MDLPPAAPRLWDRFLTDRDKQVFATSGYGRRGGLGQRPALLIVDVNYNFTGDRAQEITEADRHLAQCLRDRGMGSRRRHRAGF